jgi:hypothetical protein
VKPPWTWACLPCDATGVGGSAAHRCGDGWAAWRRNFWAERLRRAMPGASFEQVETRLKRPFERDELVGLFGESWRPDNTAPRAAHAGARREAG